MRYEEKFAQFIQLCDDAKDGNVETILIPTPNVLGDTYEEIIESLSRIAKSGAMLIIAKL